MDVDSPFLAVSRFATRNWKTLLLAPGLAALITIAVVFLMASRYISATSILPPQQSQSSAMAILGQLGALAGGTATQALGLKNPSDIYVSILKSRTIADAIISRFGLHAEYGNDYLSETRVDLARNTYISSGRDGVITIEYEDTDAQRAAAVANAYVEELRRVTVHLAIGEAGQRRLFFEGQLKKARDDLSKSEGELKRYEQEKGLVNPQGQVSLTVSAAAALRAQIAAKEIQLTTMRSFATDTNPDVRRTHSELAGLRTELAKLERDAGASSRDVFVPFAKAPEIGLEYVRRFRDVKYYEVLFEALAKQYEIARIDEAKDAAIIQTLDPAVVADRRARPRRMLTVTVVLLAAFLLAAVFCLVKERLADAAADPEVQAGLQDMGKHFRRRP